LAAATGSRPAADLSSSFRGVVELLRDLFSHSISVGTIHNIVTAAVIQARRHNAAQDLSASASAPTMRSFRMANRFSWRRCCLDLLLPAQPRGTPRWETWGIRLLELQDAFRSGRHHRGFLAAACVPDKNWHSLTTLVGAMSFMPCNPDRRAGRRGPSRLPSHGGAQRSGTQAGHYQRRHGRANLKVANNYTGTAG